MLPAAGDAGGGGRPADGGGTPADGVGRPADGGGTPADGAHAGGSGGSHVAGADNDGTTHGATITTDISTSPVANAPEAKVSVDTWKAAKADGGHTYYWNTRTKQVQWSVPRQEQGIVEENKPKATAKAAATTQQLHCDKETAEQRVFGWVKNRLATDPPITGRQEEREDFKAKTGAGASSYNKWMQKAGLSYSRKSGSWEPSNEKAKAPVSATIPNEKTKAPVSAPGPRMPTPTSANDNAAPSAAKEPVVKEPTKQASQVEQGVFAWVKNRLATSPPITGKQEEREDFTAKTGVGVSSYNKWMRKAGLSYSQSAGCWEKAGIATLAHATAASDHVIYTTDVKTKQKARTGVASSLGSSGIGSSVVNKGMRSGALTPAKATLAGLATEPLQDKAAPTIKPDPAITSTPRPRHGFTPDEKKDLAKALLREMTKEERKLAVQRMTQVMNCDIRRIRTWYYTNKNASNGDTMAVTMSTVATGATMATTAIGVGSTASTGTMDTKAPTAIATTAGTDAGGPIAATQPPSTVLGVGARVALIGLKTVHLNGQWGTICYPRLENGRWPITLDAGNQEVNAKEVNITLRQASGSPIPAGAKQLAPSSTTAVTAGAHDGTTYACQDASRKDGATGATGATGGGMYQVDSAAASAVGANRAVATKRERDNSATDQHGIVKHSKVSTDENKLSAKQIERTKCVIDWVTLRLASKTPITGKQEEREDFTAKTGVGVSSYNKWMRKAGLIYSQSAGCWEKAGIATPAHASNTATAPTSVPHAIDKAAAKEPVAMGPATQANAAGKEPARQASAAAKEPTKQAVQVEQGVFAWVKNRLAIDPPITGKQEEREDFTAKTGVGVSSYNKWMRKAGLSYSQSAGCWEKAEPDTTASVAASNKSNTSKTAQLPLPTHRRAHITAQLQPPSGQQAAIASRPSKDAKAKDGLTKTQQKVILARARMAAATKGTVTKGAGAQGGDHTDSAAAGKNKNDADRAGSNSSTSRNSSGSGNIGNGVNNGSEPCQFGPTNHSKAVRPQKTRPRFGKQWLKKTKRVWKKMLKQRRRDKGKGVDVHVQFKSSRKDAEALLAADEAQRKEQIGEKTKSKLNVKSRAKHEETSGKTKKARFNADPKLVTAEDAGKWNASRLRQAIAKKTQQLKLLDAENIEIHLLVAAKIKMTDDLAQKALAAVVVRHGPPRSHVAGMGSSSVSSAVRDVGAHRACICVVWVEYIYLVSLAPFVRMGGSRSRHLDLNHAPICSVWR